jgi:hypothetical protein
MASWATSSSLALYQLSYGEIPGGGRTRDLQGGVWALSEEPVGRPGLPTREAGIRGSRSALGPTTPP